MCVNCDLDKLHLHMIKPLFSVHSQEENIDVLGNFCCCEFDLFSPK